ncbi:Dyp-type peroxidase [Bacillus cereus]|nr:Dyp-type peroxidase [Bacillus cereus]
MALNEPIIEIDDIQGNSLAGFNKDFQNLLFFKITQPDTAKKWIRDLAPQISSLNEVLQFNNLFKSLRVRLNGEDPHGLAATWVNIAFTFEGLKKLIPEKAEHFKKDEAFSQGMAARSKVLGDRLDHQNWVIGGPTNLPDLLLIVASDTEDFLIQSINSIKESSKVNGGLELIHEENGTTRKDMNKPGHEHFDYKDGISQPGIRGLKSDKPEDFLTARLIDPSDERAQSFSKPGEPLIWPGQFVLGYQKQNKNDLIQPEPEPDSDSNTLAGLPGWARNGSYLVFRRLQQDVAAFNKFVENMSTEAGMKSDLLGAKLIGRWKSGAPLIRAKEEDNPPIGNDEFTSNHFSYVNPEPAIKLTQAVGNQEIPGVEGDSEGKICPFAAHVRKLNPRDVRSAAFNRTKMLLRRGIPYGKSFELAPDEERGLLFMTYQASIKDQFEFMQHSWANDINFPSDFDGEDPIVGQKDNDGEKHTFKLPEKDKSINFMQEWVTMTGGAYFFQPSIKALTDVLTV